MLKFAIFNRLVVCIVNAVVVFVVNGFALEILGARWCIDALDNPFTLLARENSFDLGVVIKWHNDLIDGC